jgi:hypothetical protein
MRFFISLLLLLSATAALAEEIRIPIRISRIKDGDTLVADVLLPWNVTLRDEDVREATYDAWESRRGRGGIVITEEELAKGKQATKDLTELFRDNKAYLGVSDDAKRDSFGRLLGKYWAYDTVNSKWIDVREFMRERNHLRHDPEPE